MTLLAAMSAPAAGAPETYFVVATCDTSVFRLVDLNGDGDALDIGEDLIFADWGGRAQGLFDDGDSLLASDYIEDAVYRVADLNGDGDALDLLEAIPVSILPVGTGPWGLTLVGGKSVGVTGQIGDDDGMIGIVDFLALLGQWEMIGSSCDFDGSGVGIVQFLKLLANWGPSP